MALVEPGPHQYPAAHAPTKMGAVCPLMSPKRPAAHEEQVATLLVMVKLGEHTTGVPVHDTDTRQLAEVALLR